MVRRATIEDIPTMNMLFGQVLYVHHSGRPDLFKEKGQKYQEDELVKIIENAENPVFVYVDDSGKMLGHCFCQTIYHKDSSISYEYKSLFIDDLCVEETARGQHVGAELYNYAKKYAKDNGYYNLTLHAWECNPKAVGFYTHLGMQIQQYTMEDILN